MSGDQPNGKRLGWLQFVLGLAVLAGQGLWFSKGLSDQAAANATATQELKTTLTTNSDALNKRIDTMNESLTRLAQAQERINEHMTTREIDTERRLLRLENARDGELRR